MTPAAAPSPPRLHRWQCLAMYGTKWETRLDVLADDREAAREEVAGLFGVPLDDVLVRYVSTPGEAK